MYSPISNSGDVPMKTVLVDEEGEGGQAGGEAVGRRHGYRGDLTREFTHLASLEYPFQSKLMDMSCSCSSCSSGLPPLTRGLPNTHTKD